MSTAGKVLTVLSAVMLLVWVMMVSAVAQLNRDSAKRVDDLKKKTVELREDVAKTKQEALDTRDQVNDEQVGKERDLRLVRVVLTAVERQLTTARESLSRVQIQVENYAKALAAAQADLALRNQEKADLEAAKAKGEETVKTLQGENAERLDQLAKLRAEFQQLRQKNVGAVGSPRPGGRPTGRPASFSR